MANKIAVSLRATVSLDVESLTDQFRVLAEDHARVEPAVWQRTGCAIHQRERLRLRYQRFDGPTRDYLLDPYHRVAAATAAQLPRPELPSLSAPAHRMPGSPDREGIHFQAQVLTVALPRIILEPHHPAHRRIILLHRPPLPVGVVQHQLGLALPELFLDLLAQLKVLPRPLAPLDE